MSHSTHDKPNVIHRDPDILGGTPVFIGTRVPVQALLDYLEGGHALNEFLDDFPSVSQEQAITALEQAKRALIENSSPALDECLPRALKQELLEHEVRTVIEMGWAGIKNGALLERAVAHFDVFLTVDQNLQYQQNLSSLRIPVIVLFAHSNDINKLRPLMAKVQVTLEKVRKGNPYKISA